MPEPLVSVLILSYNHEKYIRDAIEGCLDQKTDFPYEIIIHDDASTDETAKIIKEYAKKYPELIIPILQSENQYSKGDKIINTIMIPISKGKYIAFCEGDDYWCAQEKLQIQVEIMEKQPEISMCFHANKQIFLTTNKAINRYYHDGNRYFNNSDVISLGGRFYHMATCLVRKDIFEDIPSWYYLASVGDIPLALLAGQKGKLFYLDQIMSVHRLGVQDAWSMRIKNDANQFVNYVEKYKLMLLEFNKQENYRYTNEIKINLSEKYKKHMRRVDISASKKFKCLQQNSKHMTNKDKFISYLYFISKYPEIRYFFGRIIRGIKITKE